MTERTLYRLMITAIVILLPLAWWMAYQSGKELFQYLNKP